MTIKILILLISLTFYQLVTAYEDSIFLIFEDQVITKSDIQTNIGKNFSKKEVDQFINRIVDEKILIDNIKKFNIQPNEEYIETHLKQIAKENNLSTLDLISLKNFETIRENAIFLSQVENLIKIIINDPKEPNVSEIKQYIQDNKIGEILSTQLSFGVISIKDEKMIDTSSENIIVKKLEKIKAEVESNPDLFSVYEKKYSQDILKKADGSYPWVLFEDMPNEFKSIVSDLSLGEISKPFKINNNWAIVKIFNKRKVNQNFEKIKNLLIEVNRKNSFNSWIVEQRSNKYIKIFPEKLIFNE